MSDRYPWRTALVTGASAGIGEAIARRLGAAGTDLVLVARRQDRLEALAGDLSLSHGVKVEVLAADLADPAGLARVESRLRWAEPAVDLLVNNAGFGTSGNFAELPIDREDEEIRLNVLALVHLTRAALEGMVERKRGWILNVSSVASFQPTPSGATYGATKAFVTSFTEAIHEELKGTGVVATALCPGFTRTEFHRVLVEHGLQGSRGQHDGGVPKPLWMTADEVAAEGLADCARGRSMSVPGTVYKAMSLVTGVMPRGILRRASAFVTSRR